MKRLYNKTTHSLTEQSELSRPLRVHYTDDHNYECNLRIYNEHVASLRTIPCHESFKGEDGKIYEDGIDYILQLCDCKSGKETWKCVNSCGEEIAAHSIPKEDDLFEEFYDDLFDNQLTTKQLKSKYTITKKTV